MDKNKDKKEKFLQYYQQLPIQKLAAASIGRNEDTIIRWKNEDTDFADQMEDASAQWALNNAKKVKSKEWLLERVMHNHFKERKDVTSGDKPIPIIPLQNDTVTHVSEDDSGNKTSST